jgi:hypothetical protein
VPVVFFSLLRKGTPDRDRSEAKLAEAFDYVSGETQAPTRNLGTPACNCIEGWRKQLQLSLGHAVSIMLLTSGALQSGRYSKEPSSMNQVLWSLVAEPAALVR